MGELSKLSNRLRDGTAVAGVLKQLEERVVDGALR